MKNAARQPTISESACINPDCTPKMRCANDPPGVAGTSVARMIGQAAIPSSSTHTNARGRRHKANVPSASGHTR